MQLLLYSDIKVSGSKAPDYDTYGLSPTYEQAHVGLDLLTLVSY